ncbi:Macro domain-containing protein RSc0334 [Coccomyxa sp. Obi]|nr:Macro domain-containing protein RSc0334 [Coccomyxa sp. Obi]
MSTSQASAEHFELTPNTRLIISKGDITQFSGDAIVNAAAPELLGGGGVDGAIHDAAGPELLEACRKLPVVQGRSIRCPTGQAQITPGFNLPTRYVIHTVGPIYHRHEPKDAADLLADAHRNSLKLANEHELRTIAFPAISCGVYGYPPEDAVEVALKACKEAAGSLEEIHFVLFSNNMYRVWQEEATSTLKAVA